MKVSLGVNAASTQLVLVWNQQPVVARPQNRGPGIKCPPGAGQSGSQLAAPSLGRRRHGVGLARQGQLVEHTAVEAGEGFRCGNGVTAWHRVGFTRVDAVDISAALVAKHDGPGRYCVGDVRSLPFAEGALDVVCVQGGLHHLQVTEDLPSALQEVRRVLVPGGRLVVVEPWLTPFLLSVHLLCRVGPLRRRWSRLDALATMIELEGDT